MDKLLGQIAHAEDNLDAPKNILTNMTIKELLQEIGVDENLYNPIKWQL